MSQSERNDLDGAIDRAARQLVMHDPPPRLHAAVIQREASEQQYQSEQRKLDAGQSTVFLVLERQTALTTARGNELRAQTDLNKSIADLQRVPEMLRQRGYKEGAVEGILCGNWVRFFREAWAKR